MLLCAACTGVCMKVRAGVNAEEAVDAKVEEGEGRGAGLEICLSINMNLKLMFQQSVEGCIPQTASLRGLRDSETHRNGEEIVEIK